MKKLLLVLLLAGCATVKTDPAPTAVDIPVTAQKFDQTITDEAPKIEEIITVPPSDKPTVIKVKKRPISIFKKVMTNEPTHEVQSNNQNIVVEQPKRIVWKKWAIFLVIVFLMILLAAKWVYDGIKNFSPLSLIKKLFRSKNKE